MHLGSTHRSGATLAIYYTLWDVGMYMCLGQGADLLMAQLMPLLLTVSCSSKSRLVLPLWCRLTWVVADKMAVKRMCVCGISTYGLSGLTMGDESTLPTVYSLTLPFTWLI